MKKMKENVTNNLPVSAIKHQVQQKHLKITKIKMSRDQAARKIQKCWRSFTIYLTKMRQQTLNNLIDKRSHLQATIMHEKCRNRQLSLQLHDLIQNHDAILHGSIQKQKLRLQNIVVKAICQYYGEQSEIINMEQQMELYKYLMKEHLKEVGDMHQAIIKMEMEKNRKQVEIREKIQILNSLTEKIQDEQKQKLRLIQKINNG